MSHFVVNWLPLIAHRKPYAAKGIIPFNRHAGFLRNVKGKSKCLAYPRLRFCMPLAETSRTLIWTQREAPKDSSIRFRGLRFSFWLGFFIQLFISLRLLGIKSHVLSRDILRFSLAQPSSYPRESDKPNRFFLIPKLLSCFIFFISLFLEKWWTSWVGASP